MPNDMFKLEAPDLINLRKFYKRAPAKFRKTQANVLNSFAFGTRATALNEHEAFSAVFNFEHNGFTFVDWEHPCKEYTFRYIWNLYAIVHGINEYDKTLLAKAV